VAPLAQGVQNGSGYGALGNPYAPCINPNIIASYTPKETKQNKTK